MGIWAGSVCEVLGDGAVHSLVWSEGRWWVR